jgi:glycosyltransferase involved in cell wall biosynthesis
LYHAANLILDLPKRHCITMSSTPSLKAAVPGSIAPQVSVIIPTSNRPQLVQRAIASALAQTCKAIEVIVVINGRDEATATHLKSCTDPRLHDPRLQVMQIAAAGASHARNAGVQAAQAEWIALLDDDDEWHPEKLAKQLALAVSMTASWPIVATQLIARTPKGDFLRPRRLPRSDEAISDYLLTRRSWFQGEGLVQTSVIFTKRELLRTIPFQQIPKHQDWDWLLRVMAHPGVELAFVPEPLATWYLEEARGSVSSQMNWQNSLNWIRANADRVTAAAYASFLLIEVGSQAAKNREWSQFGPILREAISQGRPTPISLVLYLAMWLMPMELRRSIRAKLTRQTPSVST